MEGGARFRYELRESVPRLAWLARVEGGDVHVEHGGSVRCDERGFIEGTWVGPPSIRSVAGSTAVFGSGMVEDSRGLVAVPPSHPLERIYFHRDGEVALVSNSFAWLLEAAGIALDPTVPYPPILVAAADGARQVVIDIPTTGGPVSALVFHNLRLGPGGAVEIEPRPDEEPFSSYADYRTRLVTALGSAVANAGDYELAALISSGYDSTSSATIAAQVGCRRALTFRTSKPVQGATDHDSGAASARTLGMTVEEFDRLAYLTRDDLSEADFLATGMSGEDVVFAAMERSLGRTLLVSGAEAYRLKGNPYRPGLYRGDLSSCGLTEFRLRTDFIHVPILFFGASQHASLIRIIESDEMRPYSVAGRYDKPIQRRLAEDAGIPRGTFATVKRRPSATIHAHGLAAMAPASAAAVRAYAAAQGVEIHDGGRFRLGRHHRWLLRHSGRLRLERWTAPLAARRRALIHLEPELGSLLFRWAASVVAPRYHR